MGADRASPPPFGTPSYGSRHSSHGPSKAPRQASEAASHPSQASQAQVNLESLFVPQEAERSQSSTLRRVRHMQPVPQGGRLSQQQRTAVMQGVRNEEQDDVLAESQAMTTLRRRLERLRSDDRDTGAQPPQSTPPQPPNLLGIPSLLNLLNLLSIPRLPDTLNATDHSHLPKMSLQANRRRRDALAATGQIYHSLL